MMSPIMTNVHVYVIARSHNVSVTGLEELIRVMRELMGLSTDGLSTCQLSR